MGERKVLNKYFPPDFDPRLVPKTKWDPFKQIETRMMIPFNIQCETCGEFMYRGKKFNMRKEDVHGDDYKGIKKFRFYMKCIMCNREITFVTDPENMDYAMEHGAKRLFEVWKEQDRMEKEAAERREAEEKADAMKALEHRTIDSKLEMDIMDALEETKAMSAKRDAIKPDQLLAMRAAEGTAAAEAALAEEDALVAAAFKRAKQGGGGGKGNGKGEGGGGAGAGVGGLRKLEDSDEEDGDGGLLARAGVASGGASATATLVAAVGAAVQQEKEKGKAAVGGIKPVIKLKPKTKPLKRKAEGDGAGGAGSGNGAKQAKASAAAPVASAPAPAPAPSGGLLGLAAYGSGSEEEED